MPDAMYPLTGDGEPWYTSGTQVWNGTAPTLKPKPTIMNAMPASSSPFWVITTSDRNVWILTRFVDPVAP